LKNGSAAEQNLLDQLIDLRESDDYNMQIIKKASRIIPMPETQKSHAKQLRLMR